MKRNPIPYGRQHITEEDISAVVETLKHDFLTQGPRIDEFENHFSKYIGCKYAVAVCNATAALHLAVLSLGLKEGERVITTPITFAATANCVRYVGGEVWFADIDKDSYLLSIDSVIELINSKPRGFFNGIIPVSFGGLPINVEEYRNLANKHGLWILEDACHAPGGYFHDSHGIKQMCGNGVYADISVFSFHPVKHIACGEGGMITTNNPDIYRQLMVLRTHGISKEELTENHGGWYYEMQSLGYNYRLTDIQAALGISQLSKNPMGLKRRQDIAERYKEAFAGKVKYQQVEKDLYNAYHLFIIEVDHRKEFYDFLRENQIFAQIHYIPLHQMPYYKNLRYGNAELTNAENYYKRCISLPMYPSLSDEDQEYVIEKTLNF